MGKYSCVCRWYLRSIYCYSSRVVSVRLNLSFSVEFLLYLYKALSRSLFCTPPHHVAASGGGGRGRMVQAGMTNRSVTWCYGDEDDVVVVCELWFVCREWISLPNPFQIGINSLKPICVHRLTHEDVEKVLYLSIQVLQLRVQKKDGVLIPFKKLAGFNSHSFQFALLHRHFDLALLIHIQNAKKTLLMNSVDRISAEIVTRFVSRVLNCVDSVFLNRVLQFQDSVVWIKFLVIVFDHLISIFKFATRTAIKHDWSGGPLWGYAVDGDLGCQCFCLKALPVSD